MLRVAVLCVLAVAALGMPYTFNTELDGDWELFKKVHSKQYRAFNEEAHRRSIWEDNVKIIAKHNLEYDLGNHTYRLGMNSYGDMTSQEFKDVMNGYKTRANPPKATVTFREPQNVKYPDTVDWREKGYVTPVKNQGQCGSCWAFSATGSLEGQNFAKTGILPSLSEQNLVDCSYVEGDDGCNGGLMDDAFTYVKENNGIDKETCYKYKAKDETKCKYNQTTGCVKGFCTGFVDIEAGSETDLLAACATKGPISVAIDASHSSFQLYREGVYNEPQCSSRELDHGVLVVGYGVNSGEDYWLVKNSWGTDWGVDGYIMMSRNKNNQCGIATSASYPLV
ncbi:cathepsin L1-like [Acanthaster planci]|uniref:Cathepsin L1-like n=1 Tax=Acanthaster planci TaxID=133434 RepID=A0A8B7Z930_ACAPL|nr:cathepsin L1-like [Acanthaster planci]XP_022099776.1 cathepsin L1-like [Acanthaster planci]